MGGSFSWVVARLAHLPSGLASLMFGCAGPNRAEVQSKLLFAVL